MPKKYSSIKQPLNLWRVSNTVILLLALFLPWQTSWSDMPLPPDSVVGYTDGWDALFYPKDVLEMKPFLEEISPNGYAFRLILSWSLKNAIIPISTIGYAVFCIVEVLRGSSETIKLKKISILTFFILLFVTYPLWHISNGSWGYCIAIFGLISSGLLELYSLFWAKMRIQLDVSKAN